MKLIARTGVDFSEARAFAYPYLNGTPQRLHINNLDHFIIKQSQYKVKLMENYFVDMDGVILKCLDGN